MKIKLVCALLALSTLSAHAASNSILPCSDERVPMPVKSWLPNGATSNVCHQMVLGAGLDQALEGRNSEKVAAFKDKVLVGVHPGDAVEANAHDAPTYQASDWLETGSTATPGELWWGRTANRHIFLGQESGTRLYGAFKQMPMAAQMQGADFTTRRMMAMLQKRPMVSKPGDERFQLFPRKTMSYGQLGGTMASFAGGLGGDGDIPLGQVSNAKLLLETSPEIKGTLSFSLMVDGKARQFSFPVTNVQKYEHERLYAAINTGSGVVRCAQRPDRNKPYATDACDILPEANFVEHYDATGAFFGDHASLAAFQFILTLNSPDRNRHGATATGIIVLKAEL